jgi:opacity protein-like surface antigen
MHLSTRFTRTAAAAASAAALAASLGAGSASAAGTVDPVGPLNNAEVGYGNGWANGLVTGSANLEWNESGGFTTPRLVAPGNIYIENSLVETRMQIVHYTSANHPAVDPTAVTRDGGSKFGGGGFLTTRPILLGGVNGTYKHVHVNLQKKINGTWTTVATSIETL